MEALPGERHHVHPLLRVYAGKRLEAEEEATQDRLGAAMVAFWLAYARTHPGYDGMDALEAEAPGLLGALAWAHNHAYHEDLLNLARVLGDAWRLRGRRTEQLRMFTWAVQAADALSDPKWQRWAAHQLAVSLVEVGRLKEARAGFQRALAVARQMGNLAAERLEVHSLAVQDARTGQVEEARMGYQRALDLVRQLGDPVAEAVGLRNFGLLLCRQDEVERGRAMIEMSLALCERLSDVYAAGKYHEFLASVEENAGNTAAIAHLRRRWPASSRCSRRTRRVCASCCAAWARNCEGQPPVGRTALARWHPAEVCALPAAACRG